MAEPFILNEELTAFQDQAILIDDDYNLLNNTDREWLAWFNELTDNFEENPLNIIQSHLFTKLKYCLTIYNDLHPKVAYKISDIILTAFNTFVNYTEEDIEANNGPFDEQKQAFDMYGFFIYSWVYMINSQLESEDAAKTKTKSKSTKSNKKQDSSSSNLSAIRIPLIKAVSNSLKLNLKKIYPTTHELEAYVGMFTKLMFQVLSNAENLKDQELCQLTYEILAYSAKYYNQNFGIQTSILQNLQYYDQFSDSMAEILGLCCNKYEHTSLAEDILKEISEKDFVSSDKIGPKSFSKFLVKLCELNYKVLMKQMHSLIKHIDSEAYQMRNGLIEIIGMLIDQLSQLDFTENLQVQIDHFFDVIEERFRDNNSLVRSKLLQVVAKIAECKAKFPKRRINLIHHIIGRLEDKSSLTRKNAIKALSNFLTTHPFSMDGGELSKKFFESKQEQIKKRLEELQNTVMQERPAHLEVSSLSINPEEVPSNDPVDLAGPEFTELSLKQKYYSDGLLFIDQICSAIPILAQLLNSTYKQETLEAMDFFVLAYQYKIEDAIIGVKKMIHLVWTKDNTDEGRSIRKHLVECIYRIYFTIPLATDSKSTINGIVRNLISLTYKATLADLTSLEELIVAMTEAGHIEPNVVNKLWNVYGHTKTEIPRPQRRGAIIILGMIGHAIPTMISQNIGIMMKIGLGEYGKEDLELTKYTCIALQCIGGTRKRVKGNTNISHSARLPMSDPLFDQLKSILELDNDLVTWFSMAEQIINVIYNLGLRPDILCQEIILMYIEKARNAQRFDQDKSLSDPWPLSQLIFIVGHVAIKHIVFLEVVESELKKKGANKSIHDDEFEQVAGTAEDEIVEAMNRIRDRELLFSPEAILSKFGQMVVEISANNKVYTDSMLQISATLTMAKFMCVSSIYCEENLQLLLTILQKSKNHVIRSNIIIALGDIAVCSNILIGDNMSYLYRRLRDTESTVKKNSLMVLTHLILNGMIKVKGQLGEMAKCLQDEDSRISDLAKLFFTELASKDNAVYNNLPDMISHLSIGQDSVNETTFHKIMKFLFDFIKEKEKQCESVVEKLCQRFRNSNDPRNWRDISFCLNLIPYKSERSFKKLIEGFGFYQDKLHEDKVYNHFTDIIAKARQQIWQRTEAKMIIDELEENINKIRLGDNSVIIDKENLPPLNENDDEMEVDELDNDQMDTTD